MANTRISELTAVSTPALTDQYVIAQGGTNYKITGRQMNLALAGVAFPSSPATGDRFWRTDRGLEYYYDGTRWLTSTLLQASILNNVTTTFSASTELYVPPMNYPTAGSIYIERASFVFYSSALSGSAYWTAQLRKATPAEVFTNVGSAVSTVNGTNSNYLPRHVDIDEVVDLSTHPVVTASLIKVSTPNAAYFMGGYLYRLVG